MDTEFNHKGIDFEHLGYCAHFNPFLVVHFDRSFQSNVKPTDSVGVIEIGDLRYMAIKFLKHWGCGVIAFSST